MGRLEKKLLGRGDSRNKGLERGEAVCTCDPVAENRFQGSHGGAVNPGENQRTGPLPSEQEGERKARRQK